MIMNRLNILVVIWLVIFFACNESHNSKTSYHSNDTLNIGYLDTILTGERIFPMSHDSSKLSQLIDAKVLLVFKSEDYYYVFVNENKFDFVSNSYWDKLALKYFDADSNKSSHFTRIDYSDGPFLSGLYSEKDSIITYTADLRKRSLNSLNDLRVRYFSTKDTLLKINDKVKVGNRLVSAFSDLNIPINDNNYRSIGNVNIVLMKATSLIDNAWYTQLAPDCCPEYTTAINLAFKDNKLRQIQYLDYEYIPYLFKKKRVTTKDIHLH